MTGYSWVSIAALLCYLFLLLAFLASGKKTKVIRSFEVLMVIMILWVGGSFAMRTQAWPSVNFWHHISLLGMMLLAAGYYAFILDFLEEKNGKNRWLWLWFYGLLFVVNLFTGIFIPEPVVVEAGGTVQFLYEYSMVVYLLFLAIFACVAQMILLMYKHCKGNHYASQQLRPIIYGIAALLIGHVATTLPIFSGIPVDIASGMVNAIFVFYALYKKRLFKMTVLFSKANYFAAALVAGLVIAINGAASMQSFFMNTIGLDQVGAVIGIAVALLVIVGGLYLLITMIFNRVFMHHEKQQSGRIEQFGESINHTLSAMDILQTMTDTIQDITRIGHMSVFIHQSDGDYRVEHTTNMLEEKNYYLCADHPLVTYFKNHDGCVSLLDFSRSTVFRSMWEKEKKLLYSLNAECFVPMLFEGELVGMILLPCRKDKNPYSESDLSVALAIAGICAGPLKDANVYERAIDEARTDKLTGLINRKYFFDLLDRAFEQYKDTALSLVLLNLDDFKVYNQIYGTQEGDTALQRVADILFSSLNEVSYAARIGGKEFAIILPGYDIHSAKLMTEDLVSEIAKASERGEGKQTNRITVSAGICAAPFMASSAKELFQNAETAVYTVKRSGKNAVQVYSSEIYRQEANQYQYSGGYSENASTIYALTAAIDAKDHYTFKHSENVAYYATELAKAAGMGNDLVEIVKEAGLLHDIGKVGITEDILNKPASLTAEEYEVMKGHVENAVNIIKHLPSLDYVIPTVLSHHERYDGHGYPRKLKGEEIPIMGRILCIADSFDAMTSRRSYREPLSVDDALNELRAEAGKQFDPKLALSFVELVKKNKIELKHDD